MGTNEPLERLFLREKPVRALLAVGEIEVAYAVRVSRHIESTLPHTCAILRELEDEGLIESRPQGRTRRLRLTQRGQLVMRALCNLKELLESPNSPEMRLQRLQSIVASDQGGASTALRLGPLRRELAGLMREEDPVLREGALALDGRILSAIRK